MNYINFASLKLCLAPSSEKRLPHKFMQKTSPLKIWNLFSTRSSRMKIPRTVKRSTIDPRCQLRNFSLQISGVSIAFRLENTLAKASNILSTKIWSCLSGERKGDQASGGAQSFVEKTNSEL